MEVNCRFGHRPSNFYLVKINQPVCMYLMLKSMQSALEAWVPCECEEVDSPHAYLPEKCLVNAVWDVYHMLDLVQQVL